MSDATRPVSPSGHRWSEWWRSDAAQVIGLLLLVAIAYGSVYSAGFVWDDDSHVTANPCIIGPLGLKAIWTSASANYFPLVLTNFWAQHAAFGLNPIVFHGVNIFCHALAGVLFLTVLRRLRMPGAWLGAALWALHPVEVESAAWISELKNTQSAVFFLLATLSFLTWLDARSRSQAVRSYLLLLIFTMAAMLSKASTVMLPAALFLCALWHEKKWHWRTLGALLPLFAISAAAAGWTVWEQKYHSMALGPDWDLNFGQRAAIAGKAVWFYAGKLIWPGGLAFVYPRWPTTTSVADFVPLIGVIFVIAASWLARGARARGFAFAATYFVVLLFPVLGFFNVYYFRYSFVADHFQYLASMAPLAAAGSLIVSLAQRPIGRLAGIASVASAAALVALLAILTFQSGKRFSDSDTLWRATCRQNPECWLGEVILGNHALERGNLVEAERRERRALQLHPSSFEAHYNLGLTLVKRQQVPAAIVEYQEALRLKPFYPEAEHNLGVAYATMDRPADAIPHYERALAMQPQQAESEFMLALALTLTGRAREAIEHYNRALKLKPDYPQAQYALARTEEELGRDHEAVSHYLAALRLNPRYLDACTHLASVYLRQRNYAAAVEQLAAAAHIDGADPALQWQLGSALLESGELNKAVTQFEAALALNPLFAPAHHSLAVALRKLGRYTESATHSTEAHRLRPDIY